MTTITHIIKGKLQMELGGLVGQPMRQIEFAELIPNGNSGTYPLTIWTKDRGVAIAIEGDEFPISEADSYPLSYMVLDHCHEAPEEGTNRIVYLKGDILKSVEVVRVTVDAFKNNDQFLHLTVDNGLIFRTNDGYIALQRTYLDDFAVDVELGTSQDEPVIMLPQFDEETDLLYRFEVSGECVKIS